MVAQTEEFHDHEVVNITSSENGDTVQKKIFRIVNGGENKGELQFK